MQTSRPASEAPSSTGGDWFKTTHWSVVLEAGQSNPDSARDAWSKLCQTYWQPLYAYARRSGHGPEDAQDLVQGFFACAVAKHYLRDLEPAKARFRSFLLTALKRFMANEWRRAHCQKRGGGLDLVSLDAKDTEERYQAEPADAMTPEKAFERRWAITLLEQVMDRLRGEYAEAGKAGLFTELEVFLSGEQRALSYAQLAEKLAIKEGTLKVTVHRLRQRYRELLRLEVAHTVDTPDAINDEICHLFAALS